MPELDAKMGIVLAAMGGGVVALFAIMIYYSFVSPVPEYVIMCSFALFLLVLGLGAILGAMAVTD